MNTHRSKAAKDHLSRTIRVIFLIALVFAALAHGAVEPWSVFVLEGIIVIIVLLWTVKVVADRRVYLNVPRTLFPIAALIAVALVQSVAFTDSSGRWMSLSKNVESTRAAVIVLIFLSISFLIATNFFNSRQRLSTLAQFLVIYGLAMALFALVQHFTWNGSFYWIRHTEVTSPFGPFANHNHFAGYMEMLIPLAVALILTRAVRPELRLLYGFAAAMMGVAAVLSLSRGGIISIAASMMFLAVMSYGVSRRTEPVANKRGLPQLVSKAAIVLVIVAVITAGIFWIGADPIINRVQGQTPAGQTSNESFYSSRGWVWSDTFRMIRANPVLGVGFGAYETAFSMYTKSVGSLRVPQAHNDYLQIVADCGVVGGLIGLWFVVLMFRSVARGARSRDRLVAGLALGSGAGLFAMLVHSLFDFNLQVPSNALLFLVLSAVATRVGAVVTDKERSAALSTSRNVDKSEPAIVSATELARGAS